MLAERFAGAELMRRDRLADAGQGGERLIERTLV